MDELIDIVDENGNYTGKTCLKSEAHKNGYFHPTIHIWLYTPDQQILLQKRALTKKVFPGLWDISVAGHIAAGEDIKIAAIIEIKEEIGFDIHFSIYMNFVITYVRSSKNIRVSKYKFV
mgnify:CR=1 FL=1